MKKLDRVKAVVLAATVALVAVLGTGCRAVSVSTLFGGTWRLDYSLCREYYDYYDDYDPNCGAYVATVFESFDLTFSPTSVEVNIKFSDGFAKDGRCDIRNGVYPIKGFVSSDFGDIRVEIDYVEIDGEHSFWEVDLEKSVLKMSVSVWDKDGFHRVILGFTQSGGSPTKDNDDGQSRFADIKAAYADAGYVTETGEGELDASLATLVASWKDSYAAMGCEMCVLSKNIGGADMNGTELYVLIGAPTEVDAREVESAFADTYPCARNGRDVIVYIWPLGSANFEPFNNAVK